MDFTLIILANLNHKYQSRSNSKTINQIIFNETLQASTIRFKDAVIYAESNQYLKRQYYLINAVGINEIFQRIGVLAGFYACAIILKFEYPMMIVTETQQIFLKRLKRCKKILYEEGSSDDSQSESMNHSIELHTKTFLDSMKSSQLSKKTGELKESLFPQFYENKKRNKSYDSSIHDIHNPKASIKLGQDQLSRRKESEFFPQKLVKLSKKIVQSTESIDQTVNFLSIESDLSSLICDFDQVDPEITLLNYEKLKLREKKTSSQHKQQLNYHLVHNFKQNSKNNQYSNKMLRSQQLKRSQQDNYNGQLGYQNEQFDEELFKKKSKPTFCPNHQNQQLLKTQKTLLNFKYHRQSKEKFFSLIEKQLKNVSASFFNENKINSKLFQNSTKNQQHFQFWDQRNGCHQQTYKHFDTSNRALQTRFHSMSSEKNLYENKIRQKMNSQRGIYNNHNPLIPNKPLDSFIQYESKPQQNNFFPADKKQINPQNNDRFRKLRINYDSKYMNHKFISNLSQQSKFNHLQKVQISEFEPVIQNRRINQNISKFLQLNHFVKKKPQVLNIGNKKQKIQTLPKMPNSLNKVDSLYESLSIESLNSLNRKVSLKQEIDHYLFHEQEEQKQIKKKKIREKAAQLLSKAASRQYLATRFKNPF